jgi:hypothetical protein
MHLVPDSKRIGVLHEIVGVDVLDSTPIVLNNSPIIPITMMRRGGVYPIRFVLGSHGMILQQGLSTHDCPRSSYSVFSLDFLS